MRSLLNRYVEESGQDWMRLSAKKKHGRPAWRDLGIAPDISTTFKKKFVDEQPLSRETSPDNNKNNKDAVQLNDSQDIGNMTSMSNQNALARGGPAAHKREAWVEQQARHAKTSKQHHDLIKYGSTKIHRNPQFLNSRDFTPGQTTLYTFTGPTYQSPCSATQPLQHKAYREATTKILRDDDRKFNLIHVAGNSDKSVRNEQARIQKVANDVAEVYPREGFSRYQAENPVYRSNERTKWRSPDGFTKVYKSFDGNLKREQTMMSTAPYEGGNPTQLKASKPINTQRNKDTKDQKIIKETQARYDYVTGIAFHNPDEVDLNQHVDIDQFYQIKENPAPKFNTNVKTDEIFGHSSRLLSSCTLRSRRHLLDSKAIREQGCELKGPSKNNNKNKGGRSPLSDLSFDSEDERRRDEGLEKIDEVEQSPEDMSPADRSREIQESKPQQNQQNQPRLSLKTAFASKPSYSLKVDVMECDSPDFRQSALNHTETSPPESPKVASPQINNNAGQVRRPSLVQIAQRPLTAKSSAIKQLQTKQQHLRKSTAALANQRSPGKRSENSPIESISDIREDLSTYSEKQMSYCLQSQNQFNQTTKIKKLVATDQKRLNSAVDSLLKPKKGQSYIDSRLLMMQKTTQAASSCFNTTDSNKYTTLRKTLRSQESGSNLMQLTQAKLQDEMDKRRTYYTALKTHFGAKACEQFGKTELQGKNTQDFTIKVGMIDPSTISLRQATKRTEQTTQKPQYEYINGKRIKAKQLDPRDAVSFVFDRKSNQGQRNGPFSTFYGINAKSSKTMRNSSLVKSSKNVTTFAPGTLNEPSLASDRQNQMKRIQIINK